MRSAHMLAGVTIAVALAGTFATAMAQPRTCLHGSDENNAQHERRMAAINFTRLINGREAEVFSATRSYQSLTGVMLPAPPKGFSLQLVTDGAGYTLSVKDTADQCYFALFSDQDGLIYTGRPLQ